MDIYVFHKEYNKGVCVMKIKYWLCMMGLAVMLGACNNEQIVDEQPVKRVQVQVTESYAKEPSKILVQKRVGEDNQYSNFKEITDNDSFQKINYILESIIWKNEKVEMTSLPHFKFRFEEKIYDLWISPNKDKVELVIMGESKYAQLNKSKSAKLFELISDEKLLLESNTFQTITNDSDKYSYEEIKAVAWEFIKEKGWIATVKEDWQDAEVKETIADNSYELLDNNYEGKKVLSVSFEDKENVVMGTPIILVDPTIKKVIGYMSGE